MLPHSLLAFFTLPLLSHAARPPKNAILLSQVETLTLRGNNAKTTSRRVSPIPQLKCISSRDLCDLHHIDVMRCTNQGSSYGDEDIEWSCSASLPRELKLGSTEVICEGYSSSNDPYVLKGSCGVEYRLVLTREGEERYPDVMRSQRFGTSLFGIVFIGVLTFILWNMYRAYRDNQRPTAPGFGTGGGRPGGGGGGGGGGGWNPGWGPDNGDPPPPYPGTKPTTSSAQQGGWQPGFWSGLAGGAAAGYFAGGRNNNNRDRGLNRNRGFGGSSGSSSFGGGGRHESTGFGSTSRR